MSALDEMQAEYVRVRALVLDAAPKRAFLFEHESGLLEYLWNMAYMAGEIVGRKAPCPYWCYAERQKEWGPV